MIKQKTLDGYFDCSFPVGSDDYKNIVAVVNQGIDSRLEGFTRLIYEIDPYDGRLFCYFHNSEMQILIRRLLELETEEAESLADSIVLIEYGHEGE